MIPPSKPLLSLTAADLMSEASLLLPAEMSLQAAARLLSQARVSGAPVVNGEGRCIGVISTTDFLHWAEKGASAAHARSGPAEAVCSAWQIVDAECLPEEAVCNHMTPDPVTVSADTPIGDLARMMLDAHIHRLIVVEKGRQPAGVVSATDILAAVAQVAAANRAVAAKRSATCPF